MKIRVSLSAQRLFLFDDDGSLLGEWPVSTALRGAGEQRNSQRTPRGRHVIRAKIGAGQPKNTVFVARRPTGEVFDTLLAATHPQRDWILTRILWLSGCEPGRNRLGDVDTMRRYIYIHGTSDGDKLGQPASHGCIRMSNADIIDLFDRVPVYTPVNIDED
ncbi:L,D-transpeptidase [Propionivibrio dicarboxylicus]|uniref:L,D-transpeptidase catalytic domain n=1 Tax=Propionivibrio dicarboxylicus TaxID=83767 RepID=A0A1G8D020_9RHOO|nr:L,D-transpeptidase [Propionivibrio dicarboxylicus]SDH51125.1 L,D-transpeptidase catalytic domain [Propionivibrio dicarboxylicus]